MKEKTSKCTLSRIIVFTLIVSFLLGPAMTIGAGAADSGKCGENLTWALNGGKLTVTGKGDMDNYTEFNMPPWYEKAASITSIVIGEGVKSIGELAFYECSNLTNVVLPNTMKQIGTRAFKDCTSLGYINFPESLYIISESAFENCSSLNGIRITEGVVIIADKAFFRCSSLTSITIPASVNFLGMVVFAYCTSLVRAEVKCPISKLPDWTFYECINLVSVSLPEQVEDVGTSAFHNCEDLTNVFYSGEHAEEIYAEIISDDNGLQYNYGGVLNNEIGAETPGMLNEDKEGNTQLVYVIETENSQIIVDQSLIKNEEENSSELSHTVTSTVGNEEGLNELAEVIDTLLEEHEALGDSNEIVVYIQLDGTAISGEWLDEYAEEKIVFEVVTETGSSWQIDMNDIKPGSIKNNGSMNMDFDVTEAEQQAGIESETVYKVNFAEDVNMNSYVGINLGQDNARHFATLYQNKGSSVEQVQNVLIDANGKASFTLANVDKQTDYYVGIDASGVTYDNSLIPKSMSGEFGGVIENSLPQYAITGRTSRWGITGKQYALYVGIALAFIIAVVTIVMVFINRSRNKKAALAAEAEENDKIDEQALYDEVLKEMLEQTKNKKE